MAALIRFKPYTRPNDCMFFCHSILSKLTSIISIAGITAFDVRVVVCQDDWVITSPNVKYVLQAHIFDDEDLHAQADGQFGLVDYFQWPQTYKEDCPYSVCVPCKNMVPSLAIIWYTPTRNDFIVPAGSSSPVGMLLKAKVSLFEHVLQLLRNRCHHIKHKKVPGQDVLHRQIWYAEHDVTSLRLHPLIFRTTATPPLTILTV